jgi:DNA-binding Lrp family transcriptional regulator
VLSEVVDGRAEPDHHAAARRTEGLRWQKPRAVGKIMRASARGSAARMSRSDKERKSKMQTFFVQIKCRLGKTYEVATALADAEIASEIYSKAGHFDILAKFHLDDSQDIGHFVGQKVQTLPGIQDTQTVITFKAF